MIYHPLSEVIFHLYIDIYQLFNTSIYYICIDMNKINSGFWTNDPSVKVYVF